MKPDFVLQSAKHNSRMPRNSVFHLLHPICCVCVQVCAWHGRDSSLLVFFLCAMFAVSGVQLLQHMTDYMMVSLYTIFFYSFLFTSLLFFLPPFCPPTHFSLLYPSPKLSLFLSSSSPHCPLHFIFHSRHHRFYQHIWVVLSTWNASGEECPSSCSVKESKHGAGSFHGGEGSCLYFSVSYG